MFGKRAAAVLTLLATISLVPSSGGGARATTAPHAPFTSEMLMSRAVAAKLAQLPLMPFVRSRSGFGLTPTRTGLVRGTVGRKDLGEAAAGFGKLWLIEQPWQMIHGRYHSKPARVLAIDLRTRRISGPAISVGRGASGIASGAGSVWVVNSDDGTVSRIDPFARRVTATIPIGGRNLVRLAFSGGSVWVVRDDYDTLKHGGELIRIDPRMNRIASRTVLGKNICGSFGLAASDDAIWVTADAQQKVIRIDPTTGRIVTRIKLKGPPISPAFVKGSLWVANEGDGPIRFWRIDPKTNRVSAMHSLKGLDYLYEQTGNVFWGGDGTTVSAIDPVDGSTGLSLSLPNAYQFVVSRRTMWAISWDSSGAAALRWVDLRAGVRLLDVPDSRVA
jgi:YVTN family beta-propeller protein